MGTEPVYLELAVPSGCLNIPLLHIWIRIVGQDKRLVKNYFEYKLGSWSVLDDGNRPPPGLKKFALVIPVDHNLPDVLAAPEDDYVIPEITIAGVGGECEVSDFEYFKKYVDENWQYKVGSPILLDRYTVQIIPSLES